MKRASQSLTLNPNDPIIRGQVDAMRAEQERSARDYMEEQAARGANVNLNMEGRMAAENVGASTGAFQASLMGRELTARRDEIMSALASMQSYLTVQQQMALQRELAQLNDAINWAQIRQRAYEFDIDDEFRRRPT
ncbi:MAG: hypothetical protein ABMA15_17445 [Vicinamibacterales bacterium]